ncbi:DUF222 domain-containing protein [Microbacterium maritypicum]
MPAASRQRLDRVVSDLDAMLCDDTLAGLSSRERLEVLSTAGAALRRLEAVIVETIANGDPVDLPHDAGCRSQSELLQRTLATDAAGATRIGTVVDLVRRDVSIVSGERLPARWPALRDAMLDGALSVAGFLAATRPLEECRDRLTIDERAEADECIADAARTGYTSAAAETVGMDAGTGSALQGPVPTPDDLGVLAHALAAVLDPDGAEPDDANAQHRRGLTIGRVRDGLRPIRGWLSPEVAAQLETILDAMNNPAGDRTSRPRVAFAEAEEVRSGSDAEGEPDPFNSDPRAVIDPRTPVQKRHDAFAAALAIAARHKDMPSLGGAAPTLVVTMDVHDLERGEGRGLLPGAHGQTQGSVPARVAAQTGCTGTIQRVLLDDGRIVGISSTERVFTVHQRRAIVARDKECLIPGCHVPAGWCEIHHVVEHARGGPTDTDNGVPLCWWHHRSLDGSGWEIRMHGGVPQVRGPAWWDPDQLWRTPLLSAMRTSARRRRPGKRSRTRAVAQPESGRPSERIGMSARVESTGPVDRTRAVRAP